MEDYDPSAGDAGAPDTRDISRNDEKPGNVVQHSHIQEPLTLAERLRNAFYNRLAENGHEPAYHPEAAPQVIRTFTQYGNMEHGFYEYFPKSPGGGEYSQQMQAMFNGYLLGIAHALGGGGDSVRIEKGKVCFYDEGLEQRLNALFSGSCRWNIRNVNPAAKAPEPEIFRKRLMEAMGVMQDSEVAMPPMSISNGSGYEINASEVETRKVVMRYDYLLAGYLLGASQAASKATGLSTKNVTLHMDKWGVRVHIADAETMDMMKGLISGQRSIQQAGQRQI